MSLHIKPDTNGTEYSGPFTNFFNFLSYYPLKSQNTESGYLQRLKILASASNQLVQFKVISPDRYLVHTTHETIPYDLMVDTASINTLVPFRSALIDFNSSNPLVDYTINRIGNISNDDFLSKMTSSVKSMSSSSDSQEITFALPYAYESYEGTTIVANKIDSTWNLRTTGCSNANHSTYGTEVSHYDMFKNICNGDLTSKLDELHALYAVDGQSYYFVFVLVSLEQQYLCDYGGSKIVLIAARNTITNEDVDLLETNLFEFSNKVDMTVVESSLKSDENKKFADSLLKIQGYLFKDVNGVMFRTFTKAYHYASIQVPNHSNMFMNALHCYLKGSFSTLVKFRDIQDATATEYVTDSKLMISGLRNMLAYLFSTFTIFSINQKENGNDENGKLTYIAKKSYVKRNSELYTKLFNDSSSKEYQQCYAKVIALVQRYSLNCKGFDEIANLSKDIEKFLRTLAYDSTTIQVFFSMLYHYKEFRTHLETTINAYNVGKPLQYDRKLPRNVVQVLQMKQFNYKDDVKFYEAWSKYFAPKEHTDQEKPILVQMKQEQTIMVNTMSMNEYPPLS